MRKVWDLTFLGLLVVFAGYLYWAAPRHPKVDLYVPALPTFAKAVSVPGLITGNAVNLALQASGFETAKWAKENISATPDVGVAPDGTKTATMLIESNASGRHRVETSISGALPGQPHTLSLYVKPVQRSAIQFEMRDEQAAGKYGVSVCDLERGVVSTTQGDVTDAGLQHLPDGWFRCWATMPYTSSSVVFDIWLVRPDGNNLYSGDGRSGLLAWGLQFEAGTTPSGYSSSAHPAEH